MWYSETWIKNLSVYERAPDQVDTGLLTASGHKIVRLIKKEPIGFVHFQERWWYDEEDQEKA